MIIKRKNYFNLLSVAINHHLCDRHCSRFRLMAAAGRAFSITFKDPFRNFSDRRNSAPAASSTVELSFNGYGRGRCIGLRRKGCCFSENRLSIENGSNCNETSGFLDNNAGGSGFELHKVRATLPSMPQECLREFLSEENRLRLTNRFDSRVDGAGACQNYRESCLQSFGDRRLSEKIMVAVDVDEGICFVLSFFWPCIFGFKYYRNRFIFFHSISLEETLELILVFTNNLYANHRDGQCSLKF